MIRGKEVSQTLPDTPASVIFQQSENRLHVQKALLIIFNRRITMKKKVMLAYSGGLDTSVILKWLILKDTKSSVSLPMSGKKKI